jgi:enoyl-CoA hydratase/carnithine racemase
MTEINSVTTLTRDGDVAVITLNSPPVNALSANVRQGLYDGFKAAGASDAKAIVLICEGRTFIAGADISEFGGPGVAAASLFDVQDMMENSPVPVVAAIHGTALGGGLEVALCAHYRVAVPSARLGLPEVALGLLPGAGGTQRLPRAVGKAKAMDLCLTARMMDAAEAEKSGLVARVIPAEQLLEETLKAATTIADFSLPVVMMIKESVNRAYESSLNEGLLFERRVFHSAFALEDQKEGMAAFVEKRKAEFKNQ